MRRAADRAAQLVLWLAAGYGLFGAVVCVLATLMTGERSLLRVGSGLLLVGAVAGAGLVVTKSERVKA